MTPFNADPNQDAIPSNSVNSTETEQRVNNRVGEDEFSQLIKSFVGPFFDFNQVGRNILSIEEKDSTIFSKFDPKNKQPLLLAMTPFNVHHEETQQQVKSEDYLSPVITSDKFSSEKGKETISVGYRLRQKMREDKRKFKETFFRSTTVPKMESIIGRFNLETKIN